MLRRGGGEPEELAPAALEAGPVRMDVDRHVVTVDGGKVDLPLKEFDLLEMLLRNAGRVLTRMQLIDRVWGADYVGDTKTLDVHVKRLRAKIEPDPGAPALPGDGPRPRLQVRAVGPRRTARRSGCVVSCRSVWPSRRMSVEVSVGSGVRVIVADAKVGASTGTSTRAGPVAGVVTCIRWIPPGGAETDANWTWV